MKEDPNRGTDGVNGIIANNASSLSLNGYTLPLTLAFGTLTQNGGTYSPKTAIDSYFYNYIPIYDDPEIDVKFSYGYDQISDYKWSTINSGLIIPYIGNATTPDTSYIPIRMRVTWKTTPSTYTIRKFFLDVSYTSTGQVT
jgi:hypothetical protein